MSAAAGTIPKKRQNARSGGSLPADNETPMFVRLLKPALKLARIRVPHRQQMSAGDCGAASLAMVLSYHGRATSTREIHNLCGIGRDGVTARTLVRVASHLGLEVRSFSASPDMLEGLPLPAILHWGFNHFVVLERMSKRRAVINDPNSGRRAVGFEELRESFSGLVLTLTPGARFEKRSAAPSFSGTARKSVRGIAGLILVASLLMQLASLIPALSITAAIDRVPSPGGDPLVFVCWGMAVMALATPFVTYARGVVLARIRSAVDSLLVAKFVDHLFSLPPRFFIQPAGGDLLTRAGNDGQLREALTNQFLSLTLDGCFLLGSLLSLALLAPWFCLAVACGSGLSNSR